MKRVRYIPARQSQSRIMVIALNRSKKLEGLTGYYDGRLIKSKYVRLGLVKQ